MRDGSAESRRQRSEWIRGIVVVVAMIVVLALLIWLAMVTPPTNQNNIFHLLP